MDPSSIIQLPSAAAHNPYLGVTAVTVIPRACVPLPTNRNRNLVFSLPSKDPKSKPTLTWDKRHSSFPLLSPPPPSPYNNPGLLSAPRQSINFSPPQALQLRSSGVWARLACFACFSHAGMFVCPLSTGQHARDQKRECQWQGARQRQLRSSSQPPWSFFTLHQSKLPISRATFAHVAFRFCRTSSLESPSVHALVNRNPPAFNLLDDFYCERITSRRLHLSCLIVEMADSAPAVNGGSLLEATKTNAAAAYDSVANGPVAQNAYDQTQKASDELSNLAAARRTPSNPAATGQPLTHYHSFFSELLSWNNPRASAIAYATVVSLIFAARYLDVLRWAFKVSWMVLGVTIAAEVLGKVVLNNGLATQVRPRRYYTVPRETLDALIGDVHELINFFVIEAQRIIFAENVFASAAAFIAALISYYLVKLVPYWGLAVIGTSVVFFVPLAYTSNQELIDEQIHHASSLINSQTAQVRDVASKQMGQVSAISKQYAGDYSGKVQDLLRGKTPSRQKIDRPEQQSGFSAPSAPTGPVAREPEFPNPPTEDPIKSQSNPFRSETSQPFQSQSFTSEEAPQIPTPAGLREEIREPTAIDTEAPLVPEEPVVPNKQPMYAS
ncbi:hypothetical protein FZEAL_235 [Fusarium zealandicum]|uniref:Reticulon-like protein n=1 Tax=Fusarium zealandicum TaxID=1053134 RepID=A0A8H4UVR0_9HYPO|nr:hypothetical protein FZEAL_235 [Fusarium zealandicum]